MSFPRYPTYRESGVEWLGQIPEHWAVRRLKHACRVFPSNVDKKSHEGELPVVLCNYTDVYYNDVITAELPFMSATASEAQIEKFALWAGDTIITKDSETADDIAISAYVPHDLPGVVCGYHLSIVRPENGAHGAFVKRLFDSVYARSKFATLANGLTRVGLGQYELENVELSFPPLDEQRSIAAFLDRETAKIDALIAEQQRLMELLQEKRQAVISHAVTKGLNPDAPMKPSGVEWLGDVPESWAMERLPRVCSFYSGKAHEPFFDEDGSYICVTSRFISTQGLKVKMCSANLTPARRDDTLMVMSDLPNGRALARAFFVSDDAPYAVNQRVCILRPHSAVPKFLFYLLDRTPELLRHDDGANQTHLSNADFLKPRFPIPPLEEQVAIVQYLDGQVGGLNSLINEALRSVDLLQERRSALISAAVTGQIDVRSLARVEVA